MIKRLAPDISTRIAAGEVIERPSSVAKELIENSLDAGAKSISLYTEQGGKSSFVIEDDGCGIAFAELPLAVERYATSKISSLEDLENIATLGYRGEALASVAAVSRMEIRSRAAGAETGGLLRCEAGRITLHSETPAKPGTRIQIDDLFSTFRRGANFLKSSSAELRPHNTDSQRLRPYTPRGLLPRAGRGTQKSSNIPPQPRLRECIERRWGKQTKIFYSASTQGAVSARLWWNPISDSRRVVVMLFVNGRRVQDAAVRAALTAAEGAAYGEWAVMIDLPPHDVDVNIHPTKEEIRFRRSQEIFKIVYDNARAVYAQRHSITSCAAAPQPAPLPGSPAPSFEQPSQPPVSFLPFRRAAVELNLKEVRALIRGARRLAGRKHILPGRKRRAARGASANSDEKIRRTERRGISDIRLSRCACDNGPARGARTDIV